MNTDLMFSSSTDMWATPPELYAALDEELGFTLDACAVPENAKCPDYYTPEQDGLAQPWPGRVWCNPPYGGDVWRWVKKASETAAGGGDLWQCCCLRGRIPGGFTTTYTIKRKFVLYAGG